MNHASWSAEICAGPKLKHALSVKQLVQPLDESQGPSQLLGRGPWLVCEGP